MSSNYLTFTIANKVKQTHDKNFTVKDNLALLRKSRYDVFEKLLRTILAKKNFLKPSF